VRLKDLGQVIDDVQNNKVASWVRGQRAIVLAIQRQPGTNTVQVADRVQQLLNQLKSPAAGVGRVLQPVRPLGVDPQLR
jgi:HAE1 family hydrophobic/amphiphilic exporter-1